MKTYKPYTTFNYNPSDGTYEVKYGDTFKTLKEACNAFIDTMYGMPNRYVGGVIITDENGREYYYCFGTDFYYETRVDEPYLCFTSEDDYFAEYDTDEADDDYDGDYDSPDDLELGFNPYMGCYDYDC